MAWGFECTRCGYQETTHKYYRHENPNCCNSYQSPSTKVERGLWDEDHRNEAWHAEQKRKHAGVIDS